MADQTLLVAYIPGQGTLQMLLVASGGAAFTADSPLTLTELGTTGQYQATRVGVSDAGLHLGHLRDAAGEELGVVYWFALQDATGTYLGSITPLAIDAAGRVAIDPQTISEIVDRAAPQLLLRTTLSAVTDARRMTLLDGAAEDGAYQDHVLIVTSQSDSRRKGVGLIASYQGASRELRLLTPLPWLPGVGDTAVIITGLEEVEVRAEATLTDSVGSVLHVSAWLSWRGQVVPLPADATCRIAFRELSADADQFTPLTEANLLGSSAIFEDVFRLQKSLPGFTDDTQIIVTAEITLAGRTFQSKGMIPVLGT